MILFTSTLHLCRPARRQSLTSIASCSRKLWMSDLTTARLVSKRLTVVGTTSYVRVDLAHLLVILYVNESVGRRAKS